MSTFSLPPISSYLIAFLLLYLVPFFSDANGNILNRSRKSNHACDCQAHFIYHNASTPNSRFSNDYTSAENTQFCCVQYGLQTYTIYRVRLRANLPAVITATQAVCSFGFCSKGFQSLYNFPCSALSTSLENVEKISNVIHIGN